MAGFWPIPTNWVKPLPDKLLGRLSDNEALLVDVCRPLTEATLTNRLIAPAEEWLLDNFYLIEEQIRTAKRHLPEGYSLELQRLMNGPSAGGGKTVPAIITAPSVISGISPAKGTGPPPISRP